MRAAVSSGKIRCRFDGHSTGKTHLPPGRKGRMEAYRLCRIPAAENPFYIETIGVNAWSYEEICYYIVTYPSLIDETFMSFTLTRWLSTELGLGKLGRTLEKALEAESGTAAFVMPILKEDGYLSPGELTSFEHRLLRDEEDGPLAALKKKGDALVTCGRLAGAIDAYDRIIKTADEGSEEKTFLSSVWHNKGVAYMRLFEYAEALTAFEKALELTYTRQALKTYLYACAIARPRDRYEEELARFGVDETTASEVERELQKVNDTVPARPEVPADRYLGALMQRYHTAADV